MIEIAALALSLLALLISVASAIFSLFFAPSAQVNQRLSQQENDLTELADRVHHWMRRDSVRRAREGQGAIPSAPMTKAEQKANIVQRANQYLRGVNREPT